MQAPGGIARAIEVLRSCGLAERLGRLGVIDAGDLRLQEPSGTRGPSGLRGEAALGELVEATRVQARSAREHGDRLLLIGGDCPVMLGALAGLRDHAEAGGGAGDTSRANSPATTALRALETPDFWLHIDLDVLATDAFSAADYLQPGGLTWGELDAIAGAAVADPRCKGASVVIYNPELDPDRHAADQVIEFVCRLIDGSTRLNGDGG
jgi:arginase family enzyme